MPKFRCFGTVAGSKYLGEVEAEDAEQAEQLAYDLASCYVKLCHQCKSEVEGAEVQSVVVERAE